MSGGSILVVGGYGVVGSRIAADMAPDFPGRVVVAGRSPERAVQMAAALRHGVQGRQMDVTSAPSIAAALSGVAIVVNCIDQQDRALMWAAVQRGLAFTDITPHLVDLGRGAGFQRVDTAAKASGARLLLGGGLVPGISSVMVRALADMLGAVELIDTALLLNAEDVTGPASFDYLLRELAMGFDVHQDRADRPARPYTEPQTVRYPVPFGDRPAYLFPFSDQVLYPRTMGATTVTSRLSIDPRRLSRLLSMLTRSGTAKLLGRRGFRRAVMRFRGRRAGEGYAPYALRVDVAAGNHQLHATLSGRGQAVAASAGAAALVHSLAEPDSVPPGAWMPEQVISPGPFFQRLTRAGLHVRLPSDAATTPSE